MNGKRNHEIALFHRDMMNRKAIIKLLSSDFECSEIENWEDVASSTAKTIILVAPEILIPEIPMDSIKEVVQALKANVILVNYDNSMWWLYESNVIQLKAPTEQRIKNVLRKLHPSQEARRFFGGKWKRA
jgi:hypothetical protein